MRKAPAQMATKPSKDIYNRVYNIMFSTGVCPRNTSYFFHLIRLTELRPAMNLGIYQHESRPYQGQSHSLSPLQRQKEVQCAYYTIIALVH